jgi:hypothetical protein
MRTTARLSVRVQGVSKLLSLRLTKEAVPRRAGETSKRKIKPAKADFVHRTDLPRNGAAVQQARALRFEAASQTRDTLLQPTPDKLGNRYKPLSNPF